MNYYDGSTENAINGEEEVYENYEQQPQRHDDGQTEQFDRVDSAGIHVEHQMDRHGSSSGKLFVGGVSWETTEDGFANYFRKYGEITDSVIMIDRQTGRSRGFGFVTFADPAVADMILEEEHVIDGRVVEVKRTVPREDMQAKMVSKTKKIFVGGIPASLSEDGLKEHFCSYGDIVEHQIMVDHNTGRSRGFGFVTFENEDCVERIFSEGKIHELGGKEVEIKKAVPKSAGNDNRGGAARFGGGFRRSAADGRGGYGGKMSRGHGGYGGDGNYGCYNGAYGGAGASGFYGGYGGYGYGFGFGAPMYGGGGYGVGFGNPGVYGNGMGYGGTKGYAGGGGVYGGAADYGGVKAYGNNGDGYGAGGGYGGGKGGYGGGASSGSYGSGKGYGAGGGVSGRYHPYQK